MTTGLQRLFLFGMAALAADAGAVRIDGIGAAPSPAAQATPVVRAGRLEVRLPGRPLLAVSPWPAYLPQQFGPQQVAAVRQPHPAGPSDRISLTRLPESAPWLEIARGARPASGLVGDWQLQRSEQGWAASDGRTTYWLGSGTQTGTQAAPASVRVGRDRWCLYLLDARLPAEAHAGVAAEGEPQADWAAVRLRRGSTRCAAR